MMTETYKPMNTHQRKLWAMVQSIIQQPYAWPGGYERLLVTEDGALLCSQCVRKEARRIFSDVHDKYCTGWLPAGTAYEAVSAECAREVSEDLVSYCDHCNREFGELC